MPPSGGKVASQAPGYIHARHNQRAVPGSQADQAGDDRVYRDRVERRSRDLEGFPEPTWGGVLRRRANFPPWVDERLTIDSVNSREANLQAALEYLSADRL
jgi:hypothetical protein